MAGIQKVRLNNLNINIGNALIIGIIVAKNSPRTVGLKKKNGESRGVTTITLRDSDVDTINIDVWGSEYYVITIYERFLVGDIVEISSPKICVKGGDNEMYRPQVSSPFYLSLNEGISEVSLHTGDSYSAFLPLLHIPTKPAAGYCGVSEILKLPEQSGTVYVDLLVVVKSVSPVKTIKTKTGTDMTIRSVEIIDNTTPASINLDMFDIDTIQRAEEWRCLESVLFIADARVSWRHRGVKVQVCSRSVVTHQPYTADAEALRLYIRNQGNTRGGEIAAWAAWSGARVSSASVCQLRDRLAAAAPFAAALHATLVHLDLDDLLTSCDDELRVRFADHTGELGARLQITVLEDAFGYSVYKLGCDDELRVRFADHTGELGARLQITVLEDAFGYSGEQLKAMSSEERSAVRWRLLLEQCYVKLAASPPRLMVLSMRRASPADPIPLY